MVKAFPRQEKASQPLQDRIGCKVDRYKKTLKTNFVMFKILNEKKRKKKEKEKEKEKCPSGCPEFGFVQALTYFTQ